MSSPVSATPAHSPSAHPVHPVELLVQETGSQVEITAVAQSDSAMQVDVELIVKGASSLHTRNRTTLRPGAAPVTLSRASMNANVPWSAHLIVTSSSMEKYEIRRGTTDNTP